MDRRFSVFIFCNLLAASMLLSAGVLNCGSIIPAEELNALLQFKLNYIAKASQELILSSWDTHNASSVCESWVGIACTNYSSTTASGYQYIQSIDLASFGLEGSIAPHLGNLTFLSTLNLSLNAFTGTIPTQLMGCTSLQALDLSSNRLISPIPSSLTSLPFLKVFHLCHNSLRGHIPSTLFTNSSTSLRTLSLCGNAFTGSIPPDLVGLHAPNLQHILLWENNLTGPIPPSLGNFSDLRVLRLYSNELTGPIPVELGMLQNLQVLDLILNNLTGSIPPSLGNCTNLSSLQLTYNTLTGSIPTQLSLLGDVVTWISFSGNKLTGGIPRSIIANCSSLQVLQLSKNFINGAILVELGLLRNLTILLLSHNNFTGVIPSSLGNCTSMAFLDLGQNQLTGSIPDSLSMMGQLEDLHLHFNHLSGLLQHLDFSNFTKMTVMTVRSNQLGGSLLPINFPTLLQGLDMGGNQFTGEIPWGSLVNCTFLYLLDLSDNMLNGAIPSVLGRFGGLLYLYLQGNLLRGAIPEPAEFNNQQLNRALLGLNLSSNHLNGSLPSISLGDALLTLDLSRNDFSGSLPSWLGQLETLQSIDLSHNNFAGSIPAGLGACVALVALSLSNNHLSGDLPLQMGNLTYLELLDLSYNSLSGVLPSFLGSSLLHLQSLNVSFNNFTGPIPTDEGVFKHLTAKSFEGNPGLCGRLLNKTCNITDVDQALQKHHSVFSFKSWRGILLIVFLAALVVTGLGLLLVIACRYCFSPHVDLPIVHEAKRYTAKELIEATQGYSQVNLLGQGGIGMVYKGVLSDGQIVAIKKLKDIDNGSEEALLKEMHILSKLRHRNLVQILGCVLNFDIKALILQYMENGSLEQYLEMHIQSQCVDLDLDQKKLSGLRYWLMVNRVSTGIAHALAYLDHGYGESIIHGDVKPSNILLDSDLEPHLADFGIAKLIKRGAEGASVSSDFKGSIGYMAPEYAYTARVTTKVDVYSFGVVVLRMVTGKSPTEVVNPEAASLHEWVKSKLASIDQRAQRAGLTAHDSAIWEELLDAAFVLKIPINEQLNASDDRSGNQNIVVDKESVRRLLRMGLACTSQHPEDRPTIHRVLAYLTSQNLL